MEKGQFFYSLRMGIDPKSWDEKKMADLKEFVKAGNIDDVNVMINCEELNVGHISVADLQPWLAATDWMQKELEPLGVSLSMNPWSNLLHSDRGRKLAKDQHFQTMVDYQGLKAEAVACPADPAFSDYIAEIHGEYAKHDPKYIWMDDDFRHFNHKPIMFGCFCEDHMKLYNQALGTNYDRQEFADKVLQAGEPTAERLTYLKQAREEMNHLAHQIAKAVRKNSSYSQLALMTSPPEWHALEGRDWQALFDNLSIDQPHVSRPHLPAYNELSGLKYIREFNRNTRSVGHIMGEEAVMCPELESYMYSPYVKSNKFTQLQLETSALIGSKGILFSLFDMMGNGVTQNYHVQEVLAESKPFLNYTAEKPLRTHHEAGIKVLYSQDSAYTRFSKGDTLEDMLPREFEWLSLLATFGVATTLVDEKEVGTLKGEVVAVNDQLLRNLTDAAITQLFTDNNLILDGDTAAILVDRGLGSLIQADSYRWMAPHTGLQTYEEWTGPELIEGVAHPRMTVMQQTGDIAGLTYTGADVTILTDLKNEYGESLGNGMAIAGGHFIMPITFHPRHAWDAQYINYKEKIIKGFLADLAVDYVIDMPVVQLIREGDRLFMTNFSLDDFATIKLRLHDHQEATVTGKLIHRHGTETIVFTKQGDHYEAPRGIKAFETFVIEL